MIKEEFSPIEMELQREAKNIENACGSYYHICNCCGEKGKGFCDLREGTFTCIKCYMKKKAEELDSDPEWVKRERVWNLRRAIRTHANKY